MTAGPPPGTGPPCPPPAAARAWCRSGRFFTHLPGAGPPPCKAGRPGRTNQGAARKRPGLAGQRKASRPCPAPHQPGHRPNNRPPLPPPPIPPAAQMHAGKGSAPMPGKEKGTEKHDRNSPGITGETCIISYN